MTNSLHIHIFDQDQATGSALYEQFANVSGIIPSSAQKRDDMMNVIADGKADLILVNTDESGTESLEIVSLIRSEGYALPVILLIRNGVEPGILDEIRDQVDDCMVKPVSFAALLTKSLALIRQYEARDETAFPIGSYLFKPGSKQLVSSDDRRIRLTEKETAILRFLYRASPEAVSRDVLLTEVWGYNAAVSTHTLETHIYRLRQKIETDPANAVLLVTEAGGYKLIL